MANGIDNPVPIKIGMAVSLTGRYALLGRQVAAGAQCYVDETTAAGGIVFGDDQQRRPVELTVYDDESRSGECERRVRDLIGEVGVDLLLGPYGSGLTMVAARVAESANMVLWNHSGSADEIFNAGFRHLVGIISPASTYFSGILDLIADREPNAKRVAVVSANTGFAEDVANGAVHLLRQRGFVLSSHHRYDSDTNQFEHILSDLKRERPDCLLGVGRVEDDLNFAAALCANSLSMKSIALVVAAIDQFQVVLGERANGFIAPSQWEPSVNFSGIGGANASDFARSYSQRFDEPLDYPAVQAYAGALIAQRCVEIAGTLEHGALREAANSLQCDTLYGCFKIDPSTGRQIAHEMLVTQWVGGRKVVVWPPGSATDTFQYPYAFGP